LECIYANQITELYDVDCIQFYQGYLYCCKNNFLHLQEICILSQEHQAAHYNNIIGSTAVFF